MTVNKDCDESTLNTSTAHWIDSLTVPEYEHRSPLCPNWPHTSRDRQLGFARVSRVASFSGRGGARVGVFALHSPRKAAVSRVVDGFLAHLLALLSFSLFSPLLLFVETVAFSHRSLARPWQNHDAAVTHSLFLLFWLSSVLLCCPFFFLYSNLLSVTLLSRSRLASPIPFANTHTPSR